VDDLFSAPAALLDAQAPSFIASSTTTGFASSGDKSELVFDSEGNMVLQTITTSAHTISGEATTTVDSATCGYDFAYRRPKPTKWSIEDTEKFYDALQMYGSDQMLINTALPSFTPAQIRQKYKAEMRNNSSRFNSSLLTKKRRKLDSSKFEQQHGHIMNPVFLQPVATDATDADTTPDDTQEAVFENPPNSPIDTPSATTPDLDSLFHI